MRELYLQRNISQSEKVQLFKLENSFWDLQLYTNRRRTAKAVLLSRRAYSLIPTPNVAKKIVENEDLQRSVDTWDMGVFPRKQIQDLIKGK